MIKAAAPAKINLGLEITGKCQDGYHIVDMIMQSVSLYDAIRVEEVSRLGIDICCRGIVDCTLKENIAYKAAEAFFSYKGIKDKGVLISIEKKIPVCAGLAGGSSDGAATLIAMNELFSSHIGTEELCQIGSKIGADVPFCIVGGTMRAKGIGTELEELEPMCECGIVIITPDIKISTEEAYNLSDKHEFSNGEMIENLLKYIYVKDIKKVSENLYNKFQAVVNKDEIKRARECLLKENPLGVCMSGSGPSVFAIFKDIYEAEKCAQRAKLSFEKVYVCSPVQHGAKIILEN